jgi:IS5 family transposase
MGLGSMLRIYCIQNWFSLSRRQMEDALYEIESMRPFAGFSGVTDALPDETDTQLPAAIGEAQSYGGIAG